MRGPDRNPQQGIALPAMVFMMVIVGLMVAAGTLVLTQSQQGQMLQIQSARAVSAAKSGAEWGLWQVVDATGSQGLPGDTLPACFTSQTLALPSPLDDQTVQVSCTREPATGTVDEGGLKLASYRIVAVASTGAAGSSDFVQRKIEARYTGCKNPGGSSPLYGC